ncbi:hypothetical protein FQN53_008861 [Emmonsiellopsis sp. PD_33]|nr:hypothetical protein FQN53_008861 [Emmonsiellopsis sp. PD_33]
MDEEGGQDIRKDGVVKVGDSLSSKRGSYTIMQRTLWYIWCRLKEQLRGVERLKSRQRKEKPEKYIGKKGQQINQEIADRSKTEQSAAAAAEAGQSDA